MTIATYTVGPAVRPTIVHDNGFLDQFAHRDPGWRDFVRRARAISLLNLGEAGQGVPGVPHNHLPDALAAYRHFLYGHGADRTFSYERYVAEDPSGVTTLANAIFDAQAGAIDIFLGQFHESSPVRFSMTGTVLAVTSGSRLFPYPLTKNWQKAIGAHYIWLSANVQVQGQGPMWQFEMELTLHAEDRYNFNPGAADIATGLPDSMNGELEVAGLAHQYTNYSTLTRHVSWAGMPSGAPISTGSPNRRVRQPGDNRRIRSRA